MTRDLSHLSRASHAPQIDTPRQDEEREPSALMRRHLIDHFDASARRHGIEVAQPGVVSWSANTMFHVQPAGRPASLAKVLAATRTQPQELAAFAREQAGCLLAARVGVGAPVLHQAPRMLVTRYIEGHNMPDTLAWKPMRRALRQLRRLHVADHPAHATPEARTLRDEYYAEARTALTLKVVDASRAAELAAQVDRAHALLDKIGAGSRGVLHGDFHPGNVRVALDGSVYLIDLERWGRGEPTTDLAHYAVELGLGLGDMRRLLRSYGGGKDTPHLLARLRLSMLMEHAKHTLLQRKWNRFGDWRKGIDWAAEIPKMDAQLQRGLKHLERYERVFGAPSPAAIAAE